MKKILALLTAVTVFGITAPSNSQAWDYCNHGFQPRVVSYLRCGRPVMAVYQVCGYDRCGNPIGRWVTQHQSCGCNVCNPRPYCPPPSFSRSCPTDHHGSRSSSVSWFFSFGR